MERADPQLLWEYWANRQIHGAHHRGGASAALPALGASPGELDVTVFLSSRQTSKA